MLWQKSVQHRFVSLRAGLRVRAAAAREPLTEFLFHSLQYWFVPTEGRAFHCWAAETTQAVSYVILEEGEK